MSFAVGAILALSVGVFATITGLDRDRAFYTTVAIVVATYYALFAVMGGSGQALALELVAAGAFVIGATAGFRSSMWLVAAALLLHGVFDGIHGRLIDNPGLPEWWPPFCLAYDIVAGLYLAILLKSGRRSSRANDNWLPHR